MALNIANVKGGAKRTTRRPHSSLGYRPPAPKTIMPAVPEVTFTPNLAPA